MSITEIAQDRKNRFTQSLVQKYNFREVEEMFIALAETNMFFQESKILSGEIYTVDDPRTIVQLLRELKANREFKASHKKQMATIERTIKEYALYLRDEPEIA